MSELKDLFQNGIWYHCFRHDGFTSNGTYDVEPFLQHYHFDEGYKEKTILDVGCADGYFSLYLKQKGAARVCAIDSNKYDGSSAIEASNFNAVHYEQKYHGYAEDYIAYSDVYKKYGLTNSNKLLLMAKLKNQEVEFHTGTVYDLKPYGKFDVVLCNSLLEHVRDPITAIEQLYFACSEKSIITISSAMSQDAWTKGKPVLMYQGHISGGSFYSLSETAVEAMCKAAGFKKVEVFSHFDMPNRKHNINNSLVVLHAYK